MMYTNVGNQTNWTEFVNFLPFPLALFLHLSSPVQTYLHAKYRKNQLTVVSVLSH